MSSSFDPDEMAQRGYEQVANIPGVTFVTFDERSRVFTIYVVSPDVSVPMTLLGFPVFKDVSGPVSLRRD